MRMAICAAVLAAIFESSSVGAGVARNANFSVYVPDTSTPGQAQRFAELLLERAEQYRTEIAKEWLGQELPAGAGRSTIYVEFSAAEDLGLTWAKDRPDRHSHTIWLNTSPRLAIGETLKHEVAHAVFATKYPHPHRLPSWVEEGIASRYDNEIRKDSRDQRTRSWVRTGRAIRLEQMLGSSDMHSSDEYSYAAATSLVSFLLSRGDARSVMRFAEDGQRGGWDAALRAHYRIESLEELQTQWEAWLARQF
ncbi:MAG TPA: hypothetical protein VJ828_17685 [Lacipirellulaceae bacterium]|nr:hypothetical protein [Lacipirellulaceae bacterium]